MGYVSVIDTYGTTVYGSPQKERLSTIVIKTILQGTLIYFVCAGVLLNATFLFACIPDLDSGSKTVKATAVLFIRLTFINGILDLVSCSTKKYFSIQNHGHIVMVSSFLMTFTHLAMSFMCVTHLKLKVYGIAIATISGRIADVLIQVVYFFYKRRELVWEKVDRIIFYNWKDMVKLGLYGSVNVTAELLIYEGASIAAQCMGTHVTTAWVISFQLCSMSFAFSFGIVSTATILIGAALGNKNPAGVRTWSAVGMINTLVNSSSNALIYFLFIGKIGKLFTDEVVVLDMLQKWFWILSIQTIFDHTASYISRGVLVAMAKQKTITIMIVSIGYAMVIPLLIVLTTQTNLGILSIYIPVLVYSFVFLIVAVISLTRVSVDFEVSKAQIRLEEKHAVVNSSDNSSEYNESLPLITNKRVPLYQDNNFRHFLIALSFCFLSFLFLSFVSFYFGRD